jgi:hypothetical protein
VKPKPTPHLIETLDPHRPGTHNPRVCDRCGLSELRKDVHPDELPPTPAEVVAIEARRWPDQAELEN